MMNLMLIFGLLLFSISISDDTASKADIRSTLNNHFNFEHLTGTKSKAHLWTMMTNLEKASEVRHTTHPTSYLLNIFLGWRKHLACLLAANAFLHSMLISMLICMLRMLDMLDMLL